MRHVYSRLAAAGAIRQVQAKLKADAAANAVERAVRKAWRGVLANLKSGRMTHGLARAQFELLISQVKVATLQALERIARWGWRSASRGIVTHTPQRLLAAAAVMRRGNAPVQRQPKEGLANRPFNASLVTPGNITEGTRRRHYEGRDLFEDEGADAPAIDWLDLLFPYRDKSAVTADLDWLALLFPPPSESDISRVVYSSGWVNRIASGTRLGSPLQLADLLTTGLALGKSHQEIAKDLLPYVEGVRATARRVARTEGMRVAGAMQQAAHDQLGDLVIGYQVHSTPNPHTRPWHQQRSGTIYYLHPKPGQKGMRQCPHPPEEAEDEQERPIIRGKRAPAVAQNCLCYLTPVLSDPGKGVRGELDLLPALPDPGLMDEYFARVGHAQRRVMVGVKRYNAARDVLGRHPEWSDLMGPDGTLLTAAELRAERTEDRKVRVARNETEVVARRELLRQTRDYGGV